MDAKRRRAAWLVLALLVLALLLWLLFQDEAKPRDQALDADPEPVVQPQPEPPPKKATPPPTEPDPPPRPKPAPIAPPTPKLPEPFGKPDDLCDLVRAARLYFDLAEEQWKGRTKLMAALAEQATKGRWFLKDPRALRWLVHQGRSFAPPFRDRKWQNAFGVESAKSLGGPFRYIRAEDLHLTYAVPRKYPNPGRLREHCPRRPPYPLLVSLLDSKPHLRGVKHPGHEMLKQRYPLADWAALYARWLVVCPIADSYVDARTSMLRRSVFQDPLAEFWRHYHVDFDRFVLDGPEAAFTAATSMPVFWAGIVFRGAWTLSDTQRKQVDNFAPVPVYVVDNPKLAEQLKAAGHTQVTSGAGDAKLLRWLDRRRRILPKDFTWTVGPKRYDQVLAYWINLDAPDMTAPARMVDVRVVDTEETPNTIYIEADGIGELSLFLSDAVVDLDRNVRVVINGHVAHDDVVRLQSHMRAVGREFDLLFNMDPVRIRSSMYFGWLYPARLVRLKVRPPR